MAKTNSKPTEKVAIPTTNRRLTGADRAWDNIHRTRRLGSEGIPGFEWPATTNEQRRITEMTNQFRGMTLAESFAAKYGIRQVFGAKENVDRLQAITCKELNPGDVVELRILSVDKKGVVFDQNEYKQTIISTVNLYQYPNFRNFTLKEPIRVKVMSKDHDRVYVDPFQPMVEDFVKDIQDRIPVQANIKNPITTKVTNLRHMRSGYTGNIRIPSISELCGRDVYMQAFVPGSQITLNIESDFEKWEGKDIDTFITNLSIKPGTTETTIACSAKEYLRFLGNLETIQMFKDYTEDNNKWKAITEKVFDGNITGVCRTRNKTGVFVEIPSIGITGMVHVSPEALTSYKPGPTKVRIAGFDEMVKYNKDAMQMQHVEPWKIEDDILRKVNVKCVLKFAE